MREAVRYKPACTVHFMTETGNLVARGVGDPSSDIDNDVISVQTVRNMGADAPTFTVSLSRGKAWHKWVSPNDLVFIDMCRPPESQRRVFVGLVDDVRKRVSLESGKPERVISVTGRGAVKSLIQFDIGQVPEAEVILPNVGWLISKGVNLAGSEAHEIIGTAWDMIAKNYVNYKFADGSDLWSIVSKKLSSRPNSIMVDQLGVMNYQGSLWALFKELADEPFNELYWETAGGKPVMILRPTPFNEEDWNNLPTYEISDDEVILEDFGRSDVETYTLFSVGMKTAFFTEDIFHTLGLLPIWNVEYAKKYGIRRLHTEALYAAWDGQAASQDGITEALQGYQADLYNWNIKNNAFYNGTILVKGKAAYRVGHRLLYKSVEDNHIIEFYIIGVTHNFTYFSEWTTTLSVTRGCDPAKRFDAPVGSYTTYDGLRGIDGTTLSPFDPEGAKAALQANATAINTQTDPLDPAYNNIGGGGSGDPGTASAVLQGANALMAQGNIRYKFGGPGIEAGLADCSQFTQYVFNKHAGGIAIGRTTSDQIRKGQAVDNPSNLLPGDLVFFKNTVAGRAPSHVGIYIGNNQFIHLSGKDYVGTIKVTEMSNSYWSSHYMTARRILTQSAQTSGTIKGKVINNFLFTAYGGAKVNGGAGTWVTYSGTKPIQGRTIAVDKNVIPLGSRVQIILPGIPEVHNKIFIAEDIGGAIDGNHIDIYFDDTTDAVARGNWMRSYFGKKYGKIIIQDSAYVNKPQPM